ncbi:MAG: sodium:proton antiporter [Caldimicrobium thiodismutans]|uniref:Sodium:proton antiporter n=1 Tax=Caldimicrobium thiodismutans TaxID=1653476 RepID=A0A2N7PI62_9BACT|nr:MAG: sodium:proton antiporter [Caldimicrobium thiodismutans]
MVTLGEKLPLVTVLPFVGILLSIALFPLVLPRFWQKHFGKITLFWALLSILPLLYLFPIETLHEILHTLLAEYIPFILLISSLYIISGNIYLHGNFSGTPLFNIIYLFISTFLASLMGTSGASVVLVRPLIRANAWRKDTAHVFIFFIFLVSNIGGALTPLGDPPLFLGFLKGVPFFWTLNLFPTMFFCVIYLLILFFIIDSLHYRREKSFLPKNKEKKPFVILGWYNIFFLIGVPLTILISANLPLPSLKFFGVERPLNEIIRDLFLVLLAGISYYITPKKVREKNEFTFFPIKEVAILFLGIFMSMIPALNILKAGEKGALKPLIISLNEPAHYFWMTGILSAFLDNAPTYLTFLSTCLGKFYPGLAEKEAILRLIQDYPKYLLAISEGAVFFGALTYIGNAPNFMVRSIVEEKGIPMPSFFGYLIKFSFPILIPMFLLLTLIFYRS